MQIYLIGALIFSLLVALFAIQNTTMVTITFLIWQFDISLVLVILGAMVIGAVTIFLVGSFKNLSSMLKHKELEEKNKQFTKKIEELETELARYRDQQKNDEENIAQEEQSQQL